MADKVLSVPVSEVLYTNISYLIQNHVNSEGVADFSGSGFLDNGYRFLSSEMKSFIDEMTRDVVNSIEHYLGDTYDNASRYLMLPESIRDLFEAEPSEMFVLGNRMIEAVQSREALYRISRLAFQDAFVSGGECFLEATRKILEESGLSQIGCD